MIQISVGAVVPRSAVPYALALDVEPGANKLSRRVSAALVRAIAAGQLADGDVMPSTRTLAKGLGVARSVVVEAYDELVAAGFLTSKPGSGTKVERGACDASRAGAFSSPVATPKNPERVEVLSVDLEFDLRPGFPDTRLINEADWNRAWRRASQDSLSRRDAWSIGDDVGRHHAFNPELCSRLTEHLRLTRGLLSDPRNVFIFPGVNAAIRTLAKVATEPDRALAFEDPGYPAGRRAFVSAGSDIRPVPVDHEGLVVEDLRRSDWGVYVTPAHQFPLGSRLSVARRSALLEWAVANESVVFEDDYDGEFRYDVAPMPALRAMTAGADRVVYLGTASKVLAPDLRVAWAVVPDWMANDVRETLQDEGETVSATSALAMADFIESGSIMRQISSSHRTYSARRDRFVSSCAELLPSARVHGVDAGLHLVLTFDGDFDDVSIVDDLAASGLACAPLSRFFDSSTVDATPGLVCGYSRLPETKAAPAVAKIREVITASHTA
jgi:GntR family transcriptional regulator/MocR family aminotransferase